MTDIVVPQVGEAVSEVILVRWLKEEGDEIRKGDPLFEVDTDKYVLEIEAFADGTLAEILVTEGSEVVPQQVVARLLREGEALTVTDVRAAADGEQQPGPPAAAPTGGNREARKRVLASPKARRLADEFGIDLAAVTGSGAGGLITAEDVEAGTRTVEVATGDERPGKPLPRLRRSIAKRMQASKQTVPHFYVQAEVDMGDARQLRAHCEEKLGWEEPPSYTDLVVAACARALERFPGANVSYTDDRLLAHDNVNIGVAVSVENGLVVPVLRNANELGLRELSEEVRALAERARSGRLHEGDVGAKSLVVSNLGMYEVDAFIAIIDAPDPMILAAGRVADRCVPIGGSPSIRPMSTLTLSADHRAFDGVIAARFLGLVKETLENAFELLEAERRAGE